MNTRYLTSNPLNPQVKKINKPGRWRYYISIGGALLIKQYATDSLASNPHFIEIAREEYMYYISENQS